MKRLTLALALAASLVAAPGASAAKPAKAITPSANVLGNVVVQPDGTALVRARYVCGAEQHLWISAKQVASRRIDRALEQEGSSAASAAWLQSHPTEFVCDGTKRTQTFQIDTAEQGFGQLAKGMAWVQFCLVGETSFLSESRWTHVK
ncbi:MAG TPA: hypothetical protein VF533_08765 [Solirubrobacteraceae bacterium]|jgi:hypothetical protein